MELERILSTTGRIVTNHADEESKGSSLAVAANYVEFNPTEECECDETRGWMFYYTEFQSISMGVLHTIDGELGDSPVSLQQSAA